MCTSVWGTCPGPAKQAGKEARAGSRTEGPPGRQPSLGEGSWASRGREAFLCQGARAKGSQGLSTQGQGQGHGHQSTSPTTSQHQPITDSTGTLLRVRGTPLLQTPSIHPTLSSLPAPGSGPSISDPGLCPGRPWSAAFLPVRTNLPHLQI